MLCKLSSSQDAKFTKNDRHDGGQKNKIKMAPSNHIKLLFHQGGSGAKLNAVNV